MKRVCLLSCLFAFLVAPACSSEGVLVQIPNEDTPETPQQPGDHESDPPTPESCEDECLNKNDSKCEDGQSYICGFFDDDSCLDWSEPTPCPNGCTGDTCATPDTCTNACKLNTVECAGTDGYQICQLDELTGCTAWSNRVLCGPNQTCQSGRCDETAPEETCTDTCSGTKECLDATGWRECKDTNGDGCKEWTGVTSCTAEQTCSNGECIVKTPTCTDVCTTKGASQCNAAEDAIVTCGDYNDDGCMEWGGDKKCDYGCASGKCKENPLAWVPACSGTGCPVVVTDFKNPISGNTKNGVKKFNSYSCDSDVDESGPENAYIFKVDEPGTIIVGTTEPSGGDVDVHLLSALDANKCIARSNTGVSHYASSAGVYYVVVDTYGGDDNAGSYQLKITFLPDSGKCGLKHGVMNRINKPSQIDMPATGKVVQEAHMVTDEDQKRNGGSSWWPSSINEGLAAHKAKSAEFTGIQYGSEWCPAGEGDCEYGQGSTGRAVPWKAEAYYVCMYWTSASKPTPGTRYLVVNPVTGKAVVAAAGYETGPGDGSKIGGAVYEVHQKLGTTHNSVLTFGELNIQDYEYGPIECE